VRGRFTNVMLEPKRRKTCGNWRFCMRIAYLTIDEVNIDLAFRMAAQCGASLCVLSPRDGAPDGKFDGILYDLDYWPMDWQAKVLASLLEEISPTPVAVHSYNLRAEQVDALRQKGVAVYRCLEPEAFRRFSSSVNCTRPILDGTPGEANKQSDIPPLPGSGFEGPAVDMSPGGNRSVAAPLP
jgi:hypothetical protein